MPAACPSGIIPICQLRQLQLSTLAAPIRSLRSRRPPARPRRRCLSRAVRPPPRRAAQPDTYGVDQRSFGQVASECSKCPANSGTQGRAAQVGPGSCRTLPGYGWEDGVVEECAYGSWATGGDQSRCTECGAGYNTTDGAGNAVMGATSAAACQVDIGWQPDGSGGITPCPQGTYKATYGPAACSPCPSGTTSSWVLGATEVAQCDACLPGYGAPGPLNPAAPACSPCPRWGCCRGLGGRGGGVGALQSHTAG